MPGLKWIAVGILSLLGGYFGYRLTGGWIGFPVAAAAVAFASAQLFGGELLLALMALCVGVAALFQFIGDGAAEPSGVAGAQAAQGSAGRDAEPVSKLQKAGSASEAGAAPKEGAADASPQHASTAQDAIPATAMKAGQVFKDCAECPELVVLPAGQFLMGSPVNAPGTPADGTESPPRKVTVQSFAMGQDAVTRGEFAAFIQSTGYETDAERLGGCFALSNEKWEFKPQLSWRKPGIAQTNHHPAVCVTWNDAQAYSVWLGAVSRNTYRLPTEAEREYATRAGTATAYWWGDSATLAQANFHAAASGLKDPDRTAWRKTTLPIRQLPANPLGLHNVHGNVGEWVQDCEHGNYNAAPADASAWTQNCASAKRGLRGGGWTSPASDLRSASRLWFEPDRPSQGVGFRIARDLKTGPGDAVAVKPTENPKR